MEPNQYSQHAYELELNTLSSHIWSMCYDRHTKDPEKANKMYAKIMKFILKEYVNSLQENEK